MSIFKKIIIATMIGILSISLVGCSKNESNQSKKYLTVQKIKQGIIDDGLLKIQPITETSAIKHEILIPVKDKIEDGVVIQASDESQLQDVIIVKAKTTSGAEIIENELITYQTYLKDESPFQEGIGVTEESENAAATATVGRKENYVYLIAAPTLFSIQDKILSYIE